MHLLWINQTSNGASGFVNYLANESSYIVSVLEEDALNEECRSAEEQVSAVVYETSVENVNFELFISRLRLQIGDHVPIIAKFTEELSADLKIYFMCKFDDVFLVHDSFRDCELKLNKVVDKLGGNKRILLMEDDEDLASLIVDKLSSERVEVFHAFRGYDAIRMCQEYSFDLLITDLIVEGINGFELVNYVNASYLKRKPEIIVISGAFEDGVKNHVEQLDVRNYFDKPFDFNLFQTKVNSLLYS